MFFRILFEKHCVVIIIIIIIIIIIVIIIIIILHYFVARESRDLFCVMTTQTQ